MDLLQRHGQTRLQAGGPPGSEPGGSNLDALRRVGEELFRENDEAIRRALSGDALATLELTRQDGGQ